MATDTVGDREKMETREVTRWLSSARCPGYYPSGSCRRAQSDFARRLSGQRKHRVGLTGSYGRLERMAKGLHWNGVDDNNATNTPYPIVFATGQVTAGGRPVG